MASGKAVIQVGEGGEILAVFFQRLESLRHVVVLSHLFGVGKESLLVDAIVVGQAAKAPDRFFDGSSSCCWH